MATTSIVKPKYDYRQFNRTRNSGQLTFHPKDSSRVIYASNTRGKADIWAQTLPESNPKQLTFANDWYISGFGFSEDGESIIFGAQYQGNEKLQLFRTGQNGGIPERITPDKEKRYFPAVNGQVDNRLLISTDHFGLTMDVAFLDPDTKELEQITATDVNYFVASVSPDKKYAIVLENLSNTHNKLYLLNLETMELDLISPPDDDSSRFNPASWAADSRGFYFTTNSAREFYAGGFYDLEVRQWDLIDELTPEWNVGQLMTSKDGKWFLWLVNERGYTRMYLKNLETGEIVNPDKFPVKGFVFAFEFSSDGKYLAYGYADNTKVTDIHIMDLQTFNEWSITDNMLGGVNPNDMIYADVVQLTSFEDDKLEFDAYLYKPRNIPEGVKVPMILSIHGGPEAQELPIYNYNGMYQVLLNFGIGVLAPNIRGSTGYGITFQKKIHRSWDTITGDIKACAEFMKKLDWVDEDRLGVYGGSFGGYATLWAVTQLPEYWKIGIDIVGPSNLITFVKAVPPFWKPIMKSWIGDPVEDEDELKRMSPINYIEKIKATMLIGQGRNDPRVVVGESDQIVEKLQNMGRDVEYIVYDDEGHGWAKEENRKDWERKLYSFIFKQFFDEDLPLSDDEFSG